MKTVLANGTIIDGNGGAPFKGSIVLEGQKILAVTKDDGRQIADAQYVDLSGHSVLPGFTNNHIHLGWDAVRDLKEQGTRDGTALSTAITIMNMRRCLEGGITTIRDLGMNETNLDAKRIMAMGYHQGPRVFAVGRAITITGGHTYWCCREADGVDGVRAAVREQLKNGADLIKVMASEKHPQFTVAELTAMAEEAHTAGVKITAHATIPQAIRNVVDAGFDSIEHGGDCDDDVIEMMVEKGVFCVPTTSPIFMQARYGHTIGMPQHEIDRRAGQMGDKRRWAGVKRMAEAGVKLAFGNDAGSACVPHNDVVNEVKLLIETEAIHDVMQAILMLSRNSAELNARDDFGALEPGRLADVVVLEGNPLEDVDAFARVRRVYKDGKQVVGVSDAPRLLNA